MAQKKKKRLKEKSVPQWYLSQSFPHCATGCVTFAQNYPATLFHCAAQNTSATVSYLCTLKWIWFLPPKATNPKWVATGPFHDLRSPLCTCLRDYKMALTAGSIRCNIHTHKLGDTHTSQKQRQATRDKFNSELIKASALCCTRSYLDVRFKRRGSAFHFFFPHGQRTDEKLRMELYLTPTIPP